MNTATASPCVRLCCLDDNDTCLGCFRTLDEIRRWRQVDDSIRRHFLNNAQHRQQLSAKKG